MCIMFPFCGQLCCTECHDRSGRTEYCLSLSLSIDGITTLREALDSHTRIETLEESPCNKCQCTIRTAQIKIKQLPEVVVIQLKRFATLPDDLNRNGVKVEDHVNVDLNLDLADYMSTSHDVSFVSISKYFPTIQNRNV